MHSPYYYPLLYKCLIQSNIGSDSLALLSFFLSLSFHVLGYYSFLPFFGKPFPFSTFTIFFTILSLSISLFTIIIFINTKHLYITIYLVLFILDNKRSYATSHLYIRLVMICSYGCRPNAEPRKNIMLFIIIFVLLYFQFVINIYIFFLYELT